MSRYNVVKNEIVKFDFVCTDWDTHVRFDTYEQALGHAEKSGVKNYMIEKVVDENFKIVDTTTDTVVWDENCSEKYANSVCELYEKQQPKFNIGDKVKIPNQHDDTIFTIKGIEPGDTKCLYYFSELDNDDDDGWYSEVYLVAA